MAHDFKGFEQSHPQSPILPGGFLDNGLKQPALFGGRLLQEQFTRAARQPQHVDRLIDGGWHGLLGILNPAQQAILFATPDSRVLFVKFLGDPTIELIQVHRLHARLNLVEPSLQLPDSLGARRLLGLVGGEDSVTEPFEDRRRNDQALQDIGEFLSKDLLARVRFTALAAVAGAVVIHVLSLLELAHKQAAAVTTANQSGVREIVLYFASLVFGASIQQLLYALPAFARDERLMSARVRCTVPIKIAAVQTLPKNLMSDAAVEPAISQLEPLTV